MKLFAALLAAALVLPPFCGADELKPKDFDGAMSFTGREGGLLTLEIPPEVYRGAKRPDLGDIRIFDAGEIPVPYAIRVRPNALFTPPEEEIPFYVLDAGKENETPSETDIEINTSGRRVQIKNRNTELTASPVYLADISFLRYAPRALRIHPDSAGKNFNTRVSVQYSDDLSGWKTLGKKQVLAAFGNTLQDTITLGGATGGAGYLLLSFDKDAPPLSDVTALFGEEEADAEYREETIRGELSADRKTVNYSANAFYPAESIDFILPEADSIPVIVKSRIHESGEWKVEAKGTIFRYNSAENGGGKKLKNEAFILNPESESSRSPFWQIEAAGGLPFGSTPDMVIRFRTREIIFPARGKGPWTLAYGNAGCPPLFREELLAFNDDAELEAARFTGEQRYTKSEAGLPRENNYGAFFLWAFLGAAVIILSVLAFYITKSMRK